MAKKSKKSSTIAPNDKKQASILKRPPGSGPKNPQSYGKKGGKK